MKQDGVNFGKDRLSVVSCRIALIGWQLHVRCRFVFLGIDWFRFFYCYLHLDRYLHFLTPHHSNVHKNPLILLRAMLAATKMLRDLMIEGVCYTIQFLVQLVSQRNCETNCTTEKLHSVKALSALRARYVTYADLSRNDHCDTIGVCKRSFRVDCEQMSLTRKLVRGKDYERSFSDPVCI